MFKKVFSILLIISLLYSQAKSQVSAGGSPKSFSSKTRSDIPVVKMQHLDNDSLKSAEINSIVDNQPLVFAKTFDVNLNLNNCGQWDTLSNGDRLWRVGINSPGAYSINLIINNFNLPEGSQLFIYNREKDYILGAFGAHNNRPNRILPVAPVKGDFIFIEYFEPHNVTFKGELSVSTIGHDYKGLFLFPGKSATEALKAQPCQININCPDGNDWQIDKHSVVKIIVNAREMCTGVLVNNTRNDGAPYLLTANHCFDEDNPWTDASYTIAIFNYENSDCDGNTGQLNQALSGAEMVATSLENRLDFALIKLTEIPPSNYSPYFSGWDRRNNSPTNSTAIHHPDGDIKKISFDYDKAETGSFNGYDKNTHWKIKQWDRGVTEKGSSGCPLFNESHRVIGTLTGGSATCDNPVSDYFSKFSVAWETFPLAENSLKQWLDPINSGVFYIDGFDPYVAMLDYNACLDKIYVPESEYCEIQPVIPEILLINKGKQNLTNVVIKYQINDNQVVEKIWQGFLLPNKSINVKLSKSAIYEGKNTFKVWTEKPNGTNDQDKLNDTLSLNFNANYGKQFFLDIFTDSYGQETHWSLFDNLQNIVYQGDNYLDERYNRQSLCLKDGCYTFSIKDRENDGMCCFYGNGGYTLVDATSEIQLFKGNTFSKQAEHVFCNNSAKEQFDIQIVDIVAPKIKYCQAEQMTPEIIIRNFGNQLITTIKANCKINDTLTLQNDWTGSLLPDSTIKISFPKTLFNIGEYIFNFDVNLPQEINEISLENNKKSINVSIIDGQVAILEIKTDNYGSEVTWELRDHNNVLMDYGGPYRDGKEQVKVKTEYCLDTRSCYNFVINDKHGDGLCCTWMGNGYFSVKKKATKETIFYGDEFGAQVKKHFCMFPLGIEAITPEFSIKVNPNPATNQLTIEASDIQQYSIEIFSITGQTIYKDILFKSKTLDITNWSKGLYLINIQTDTYHVIEKFIKE